MNAKVLTLSFVVTLLALVACNHSPEQPAEPLLKQIEDLYAAGQYQQALDSIQMLRMRYPEAVESRRKALRIWQEASLLLAQQDIARTDSALQATIHQIEQTQGLYESNMLRYRRDSLQARYEAMCGVVRMIRMKMSEEEKD